MVNKLVVYKPITDATRALNDQGNIKPLPFNPTFLEYLYLKGVQIQKNYFMNQSGTFTIYTIPTGYTLFLTNWTICGSGVGGNGNALRSYLGVEIGTLYLNSTISSGNLSQNYPFPLIIPENSLITIDQNNPVNINVVTATIQGFLLPNKEVADIYTRL